MKTSDEKLRLQIIKKAMTTCRHFNGVQNDKCLAGVTYQEGSAVVAMPCIPSLIRDRESWKCELFATMTREEAEAEADEYERIYARLVLSREAAKDHAKILGYGKGHGGVGSVKCPCCDEGQIRYSVASLNGHMHARCTTAGCVSWME